MKKTVIITGGSSGIGKALALAYAQKDYRVYTLSRRQYQWNQPHIHHYPCDITQENDLKAVAGQLQKIEASELLLICCAGFGIAGSTEDTSLFEAKHQMDVNFFGVFLTIQSFLPLLKRHRHSKIIFISSVAGEIAIPFQSFYSASKAATNKLLEAWQLELKLFGIQICSFLLGDIQSDFSQNRQKIASLDKAYQERFERSIAKMEADEKNGIPAEKIAKIIVKRSQAKKLPAITSIGPAYHFFLFLQRVLPRKWVLFLVYQLYAK